VPPDRCLQNIGVSPSEEIPVTEGEDKGGREMPDGESGNGRSGDGLTWGSVTQNDKINTPAKEKPHDDDDDDDGYLALGD
jgi:hypothetical protein